jgi:UDPglucose 6-dehydrogenase
MLAAAEVVWITFDTPVNDEDRADVEAVLGQATRALTGVARDALVVSSSQLPVGSVAELARRLTDQGRDDLRFAWAGDRGVHGTGPHRGRCARPP